MNDLRHFIISQIRAEGPVTFARFMDWCLYHPDYGYYGSGRAKIGKEGDYYTGPCVSPLFGGMVAKQLCQMSELLGNNTFTILEIGGGRGFLCADILAWMKRREPAIYGRIEYCLIERSPVFLAEQRHLLAESVEEGKVSWLSTNTLASEAFSLTGCIISNELVDAFPVHRLICEGGEPREIYVDEVAGQFVERHGALSDPGLGSYFSSLDVTLVEGQMAEVSLQALMWLEEMANFLKRGFLLTIDYGDQAVRLYDSCRSRGTLRCFYQHQLSDSPFENVGQQDITAHVNFTALMRKGEEMGIALTGLVPQYRFLLAMGLLDEMAEISVDMDPLESLQLRLSLKSLIEPEKGMGEIFKVLIQHKGLEKPALQGLQKLGAVQMINGATGGQIIYG